MGQMHHGFTTFQKIEAQAQESSFKNWATRSTNSSSGSDDIDINGDKPLRGYTREQVECLSEDLHFVIEIVDNRERIAKIKT